MVGQCIAAAHAISHAGVLATNSVHALTGRALRPGGARIPVVLFIGTLIAVAPSIVFAIAVAILSAA